MEQKSAMNHFYNAYNMGEEIFTIFENKTDNGEIKELIDKTINMFHEQKALLLHSSSNLKVRFDGTYTFPQKNAIMLEKLKSKTLNSDFDLCIEMIKNINSALIGALKFLTKYKKEFDAEDFKIAKKTLSIYDDIIVNIKHYIFKNLI